MSDAIDGAAHVPLGEGLVVRRLRLAPPDVVRLRGILAGYDGLASAHGDRSGVTLLITTCDREAELDAWLADVAQEIAFERLG
ncbi:MAG: DUF4911 domain-containing protein [Myxococcota bacterium]|nr:DUF4911 domain-containing protein [Myxococcota bacterium]